MINSFWSSPINCGESSFWIIFTRIPLINLFYDLFFDSSPPTQESTKSLLDVLSLLNALLLATAVSAMTQITFNDLVDADNRYMPDILYNSTNININKGYVKYWNTYYAVKPSTQLYIYFVNCIGLFFLGILTIVYVYTDMIAKNGKVNGSTKQADQCMVDISASQNISDDLKKATKETEDLDCFTVWWAYAKISLLVVILTTVCGLIYCVLAANVMFAIKYPDYYISQHGKMKYSLDCPTGYSDAFLKIAFPIVLSIAVISCGFGTAAKYAHEAKYASMTIRIADTDNQDKREIKEKSKDKLPHIVKHNSSILADKDDEQNYHIDLTVSKF